jgi:hypothetical protein
MSAEFSNFSLLKYYNKSLLELNSYSKNSPIIYKSDNFINYYLCNDLIVSIYSDYLNGIKIPSIGYLNVILTKWWYDKIPFIKLNVLKVENNLIISNKINTVNVKFLIFNNQNNLQYLLKKISQIKQTEIIFNKSLDKHKYKNNFILIFDSEWNIIEDNDSKDFEYCRIFTNNIYNKGFDFCKKNNINLDSSIFLFGNNETNKLFIINNPFDFDNSIYNLHEYYNLPEDKSKILKYFKNIINSITGTKDYLVSINKNIDINREIYKYYIKNSNIFLINYHLQDDNLLHSLKKTFDDNNIFYVKTDNLNQSLIDYYKINKSIILIFLIENKTHLHKIDYINLPCIIYSKKQYQNIGISNYIFVDSTDQILELCLKINLNKIM